MASAIEVSSWVFRLVMAGQIGHVVKEYGVAHFYESTARSLMKGDWGQCCKVPEAYDFALQGVEGLGDSVAKLLTQLDWPVFERCVELREAPDAVLQTVGIRRPGALTRAIACRRRQDAWRRRAAELNAVHILDDDGVTGLVRQPDDIVAGARWVAVAERSFQALAEKERIELLERYFEGLDDAEIATHSRATMVAVRGRRSRAQRKLREEAPLEAA